MVKVLLLAETYRESLKPDSEVNVPPPENVTEETLDVHAVVCVHAFVHDAWSLYTPPREQA